MFRVGACGWQYDDWVSKFYPEKLRGNKGAWLDYYAERFDTVEIDSTYYSFPAERAVSSWIAHAKGRKFDYSLKLPKDVTHVSLVDKSLDEAIDETAQFEKKVLSPMKEAGCLGGTLVQLSPYFKNEGTLESLERYLGALDTSRYDYAIEFRHRSWLSEDKNELREEVLRILSSNSVANCITDGPGFPITRAKTAKHAYVRFHGRNYDLWYATGKKAGDERINRYDYLYSDEELRPWAERIKEMDVGSKETRIYFNNHGHAKAIKNAASMMIMLGMHAPSINIRSSNQATLF